MLVSFVWSDPFALTSKSSEPHYDVEIVWALVMDNYVKHDEILVDCPPPFPKELVDGLKVMLVKEGTKFRNILGHVEKQFKDPNCRRVIFKGVGEATAKCISCVEVFKRSFTESVLYQWNEVVFSRKTDIWKPTKEGLSDLLVHVDVPTIFILISRDPFPQQYINDSCQSSNVEVIGFATNIQRDAGVDVGKPKIKRPSEPNKWKRASKKSANLGIVQHTKSKPISVSGENS